MKNPKGVINNNNNNNDDAQPKIYPVEWDAQNSLEFWNTNGPSNFGQTTRLSDSKKKQKKKKKSTDRIEDFSVLSDHRVKINESEKRDPIYPTPPLGQDMTQGQFLSGV